jgi:hypothetical protein
MAIPTADRAWFPRSPNTSLPMGIPVEIEMIVEVS